MLGWSVAASTYLLSYVRMPLEDASTSLQRQQQRMTWNSQSGLEAGRCDFACVDGQWQGVLAVIIGTTTLYLVLYRVSSITSRLHSLDYYPLVP